MRDAPPKIIHMPLQELLDPELSFDDPDSAGDDPTAYIHAPIADQMAKALRVALTCLESPSAATVRGLEGALAAYDEATNEIKTSIAKFDEAPE